MVSKKLTSVAVAMAVIAGGIGISSISVHAATQNQNSTGKVTFTEGELTLDQVPNFDFGSQQIKSTTETYGTQSESKVQVTDLRGSSQGWNLTVTAGKLKTSSMEELAGAQVTLHSGVSANNNGETVNVTNGVLTPESAVKVLDAASGHGNGVSTGTWAANTGVTLEVPGTSTKKAAQYTADLIWTLTDAPVS